MHSLFFRDNYNNYVLSASFNTPAVQLVGGSVESWESFMLRVSTKCNRSELNRFYNSHLSKGRIGCGLIFSSELDVKRLAIGIVSKEIHVGIPDFGITRTSVILSNKNDIHHTKDCISLKFRNQEELSLYLRPMIAQAFRLKHTAKLTKVIGQLPDNDIAALDLVRSRIQDGSLVLKTPLDSAEVADITFAALPQDFSDLTSLAHQALEASGGESLLKKPPRTQPNEKGNPTISQNYFDAEKETKDIDDELKFDNPALAKKAIESAYEVGSNVFAPFIVGIANSMLPDLKKDIDQKPNSRIVFVGRDGLSLALAVAELDPVFFKECCSTVVLSRASVETAIQDLESDGHEFSQLEGFRRAKNKVSKSNIAGAKSNLNKYLAQNKIPIKNGNVTLVDTSFKGTVQELLSAIYPSNTFFGRYCFLGKSPLDPNKGTKKGYVVEIDQATPLQDMPSNKSLTFANQDAISIIEDTLHGPLGSPKGFDLGGPIQTPLSESSAKSDIDISIQSEKYSDPKIRQAVKSVLHKSISDHAANVKKELDSGLDVKDHLTEGNDRMTNLTRDWVTGKMEPSETRELLDSFVKRRSSKVTNT